MWPHLRGRASVRPPFLKAAISRYTILHCRRGLPHNEKENFHNYNSYFQP